MRRVGWGNQLCYGAGGVRAAHLLWVPADIAHAPSLSHLKARRPRDGVHALGGASSILQADNLLAGLEIPHRSVAR
jgi:hypothetical protein